MVKALNGRAKELGIPLKIILTAWTPPPEWKSNKDAKNGGYILPQYYADYGHWWVQAIGMYKKIGVDVYAVSLQNEPAFPEPYNSMQIQAKDYVELVKVAVPIIKTAHPDLLVFGAEGMLEHEHAGWGNLHSMFHTELANDPKAFDVIDRFAVHGYADGVHALGIDKHRIYWEREKNLTVNKPNWMTETSGYSYDWLDSTLPDGSNQPGALNLAAAIQSALLYGDLSAWVWWQGHENQKGSVYSLWTPCETDNMNKFAVSKQFYRYIRPGAVRIDTKLTGVETEFDLLVTAYRHDEAGNIVAVLVNTSETDYSVSIDGLGDLDYEFFISSGDGVYCESRGIVSSNDILIPSHTVVTLVSGGYTF
jgi:O-glycosyl hydrolase